MAPSTRHRYIRSSTQKIAPYTRYLYVAPFSVQEKAGVGSGQGTPPAGYIPYTQHYTRVHRTRAPARNIFRLGPSSIHPQNPPNVFTSIRIRTFLIPSPHQDEMDLKNKDYSRYKDYRSTSEQRNGTITPLAALKKHARLRALSLPGWYLTVQLTRTESTQTNASYTTGVGAGGCWFFMLQHPHALLFLNFLISNALT